MSVLKKLEEQARERYACLLNNGYKISPDKDESLRNLNNHRIERITLGRVMRELERGIKEMKI